MGNVYDEVVNRIGIMEEKQIDLENRSRRNNIVVHGVEEQPRRHSMDVAYELIERGCGIDTQDMKLHRAHRLGRGRYSDSRPRSGGSSHSNLEHRTSKKLRRRKGKKGISCQSSIVHITNMYNCPLYCLISAW